MRHARLMLAALCLMPLMACSKTPRIVQTPPLQANLAAPCPMLPDPPSIDPMRLTWELDVLRAYADCAARHWQTVRAWPGR